MKAQIVSLEIDSIAAGGDGIGRSGGLAIFVPRTAPGDLVTARIAGKGSFARGSLRCVARPSPLRVEPLCLHYTRDHCGGCQLQHITYQAQLAAKQKIVRDAIERIGKRPTPLPQIRPSANEWRYRSRLTLTMKRSSTGSWVAGLHKYDDPSRIFALNDCPITDKRVIAAWREILAQSGFFPGVQQLRGSVRITEDGPAFTLIGGMRFTGARNLFDGVPGLAALWWENDEGARRLMHDRRQRSDRRPPSASFAQVNESVAGDLQAHVIERVLARSPVTVVDAYAGAGDTALALAGSGARVTAIELDAEATEWSNARLPEGSTAIRARVEDALPSVLPADVVILNPPRSGVDGRVTEALEKSAHPARSVVYVSCNPATLARDISRLPGYRIESVVAFDMFPQTSHVETVCEMVPVS